MITLTTLADISRLQHNLITCNRAIGQSGNRAIGQSGNRAIGQSGKLMSPTFTANLLLSSFLFDWNCRFKALFHMGGADCPQSAYRKGSVDCSNALEIARSAIITLLGSRAVLPKPPVGRCLLCDKLFGNMHRWLSTARSARFTPYPKFSVTSFVTTAEDI